MVWPGRVAVVFTVSSSREKRGLLNRRRARGASTGILAVTAAGTGSLLAFCREVFLVAAKRHVLGFAFGGLAVNGRFVTGTVYRQVSTLASFLHLLIEDFGRRRTRERNGFSRKKQSLFFLYFVLGRLHLRIGEAGDVSAELPWRRPPALATVSLCPLTLAWNDLRRRTRAAAAATRPADRQEIEADSQSNRQNRTRATRTKQPREVKKPGYSPHNATESSDNHRRRDSHKPQNELAGALEQETSFVELPGALSPKQRISSVFGPARSRHD